LMLSFFTFATWSSKNQIKFRWKEICLSITSCFLMRVQVTLGFPIKFFSIGNNCAAFLSYWVCFTNTIL
jgi:hypothetical protein